MAEEIVQKEKSEPIPTVNIHVSKTGRVQITFAGAMASMDEASGEAVLTIHATQLEELRDAMSAHFGSM